MKEVMALEISINGARQCVAALGKDGGLVALHAVLQSKDGVSSSNNLTVGGLFDVTKDVSEHVDWLHQALALGDEVTIRVVKVQSGDAPIHRKVSYEDCYFCLRSKGDIPEGELLAAASLKICKQCIIDLFELHSRGTPVEGATFAGKGQCGVCGSPPQPFLFARNRGRICKTCIERCALIPLGPKKSPG